MSFPQVDQIEFANVMPAIYETFFPLAEPEAKSRASICELFQFGDDALIVFASLLDRFEIGGRKFCAFEQR